MSGVAFVILTIVMLAAALAAAIMPKLIHAALAFAITFVGVAGVYLLLGAEFVGLVQVFVYIGAVAVLIVFTILLTRREGEQTRGINWSGPIIATAVFAGLFWVVLRTPSLRTVAPQTPPVTVKQLGEALMTSYVWPLQLAGVLLTVALVGALLLAMEEK